VKQNLLTNTGRGLKWARNGEVLVAALCVAALLTRAFGRFSMAALALGGLVAIVSIVRFWQGQEEFGPQHRTQARRGCYAFLLASLLFVLALFSFNTFTAATTGIDFGGGNETNSPTPTHRFKDLEPPVLFLAVAVVAEASSGALLLWQLVGDSWRRIVQGYVVVAAVVGGGVFAQGLRIVGTLTAEAGPGVDTAGEAQRYFDRFLGEFLPVFLGGFLILRALAYVLVRHAMDKVAQAEAEAARESAGPTASAPSP